MTERGEQEIFSPLESVGGTTTIADTVVSQIAGIAAGEVEELRLGGSRSRRAGEVFGRAKDSVGRSSSEESSLNRSRGVSVEVGQFEVAVDLKVGFEYGVDLSDLAGKVREKVVNRIENLVGLAVTEVNLIVTDIVFPDDDQGQSSGGAREGGSVGRTSDGGTFSDSEEDTPAEAEPARVPDGEFGTREGGVTRVEPTSRTHTESETGPVPEEEEVYVEDVPLETGEVAELDLEKGKVEKRRSESGDERRGEDRD